ncbi:hypothetical protein [Aquibacillus saliphilus]|uniref:hypothetical protein n=1 Tax=Aquibacillus saliphilus TaxID=1909422 RepID=UPI001CF0CA82|nr:hypothetical protein [Aquibacillus saliphilus]
MPDRVPGFHGTVMKHLGDIEKHLGKNEKWFQRPEKRIRQFEQEMIQWDHKFNGSIKELEITMLEFEKLIDG